MSKQKKEKQPPVLGRLLEYAGGHKWLSVLGCGLSGVSAAVGIFPFVFVWYAAQYGQPLMPSGICQQPAQHRRLLFFLLFAHIPCSFLKIYGFVGGCAASVRGD